MDVGRRHLQVWSEWKEDKGESVQPGNEKVVDAFLRLLLSYDEISEELLC